MIGTGTGKQPETGLDIYGGVQKLYESDNALTLETSLFVGRARLNAAITSYREALNVDTTLSVNVPSLTMGVRLTDDGPTRVYVEAGGAWLATKNDPVMDTTIGGGVVGLRFEQVVTKRVAFLGDLRGLAFENDVRATEARIGLQIGHVRVSFRAFDTNVGPSLFGPEIGLGVRF